MKKYIITFCVLLYAIVVPFLEINKTHVFNPDWTPHVRIHEVWQLLTNSSIGILCLWLVWVKNETRISATLSLLITGGFLVAFMLKDFYGGSMQYLDGSEKTLLGVNIGILGFGVAFILLFFSLLRSRNISKKGLSMKKIYVVFLLVFAALLLNACNDKKQNSKNNNTEVVEKSYLGQEPPGLIPMPFAPGIVTTEHYEYSGVFSPDMNEFYLIRSGGKYEESSFVVFQNKNNQWQETVISSRVGQPFIAPDGKTMHFGNKYKKLTEIGWTDELQNLGAPFEDFPIMRLTASSKGTYFFDEFKSDFTGDIRYSRLVNGKHEEPKLLNKNINSGKSFHPFIAPDESYLIFDSKREGGYGDSDLYICYRQKDGTWGKAINLGDKINTKAWEAAASVTPDGKYLFFNRNMGSTSYENVDIFWVDAQVIENLKPE